MLERNIEIEVGKYAGFCYGVKNAVDLTRKILSEKNNVFSTDHIVHNDIINNEFEKCGLNFVKVLEDIPDGSTVILRAHGVGKDVIEKCQNKQLHVINTTCKNVSRIHDIVSKYSNEGYKIVIVGDKNHDEINGIIGWIDGDYQVVSDFDEVEKYEKICVVSQTTTNIDFWNEIVEQIKSNSKECVVCNTICMATYNRQTEAKEIASRVDTFFVIGDLKSANSKRLYEVSKEYCKNTHFIQTEDDIKENMLRGVKVGITAGASTPDVIIDEVSKRIQEIINART